MPQVFTGMFANDWPAACAAHSIATIKIEQLASMRDSANSDTVMRANPPTEMARGPNLSNTTPEMGLIRMPTAAAGSIAMPVCSAVAPIAV